ncbi:MAG: hypothetical protein N2C14_30975 [Planctomycetales bacterium]
MSQFLLDARRRELEQGMIFRTRRLIPAIIAFALLVNCLATFAGDDPNQPAEKPEKNQPALPPVAPRLTALTPAGVERGKSVIATLQGKNLKGVTALRVNSRGVTARIESPEGKPVPDRLTIKITADSDAKLGGCELRLLTPGGVSNAARFVVGDLPETTETEPNETPSDATPTPSIPAVINGVVGSSGDRDCFGFTAKAGQTWVFDLTGRRLHPFLERLNPGWFEGFLTLRKADGRQVAYAAEFGCRTDPTLIHEFQQDGEYVIEVRDEFYRGRNDFVYRLAMGELPLVTRAFPLGGKRGTTAEFLIGGVNLGKAAKLKIAIPADAPLGRRRQPVAAGARVSNEITLAVGDRPERTEANPNQTHKEAEPIQLPVTINGVIERDGDFDCFQFKTDKGQRLIFSTLSRSLGSPLDARLDLLTAEGKLLKHVDDAGEATEAVIDYTFKAAGSYVIRVGDLTRFGGPQYAYRLSVGAPQGDFALTVSPDNPRVTAGGSVALTVQARRIDGFDGEVVLSIPNAPPGAIVGKSVFSGKQLETIITLTIPADAEPSVVPLTVSGQATIGDRQVTRRAAPMETIVLNNKPHRAPAAETVLGVLGKSPFTLAWKETQASIVAGSKAELTVVARRASGFKEPIRVMLAGLPTGVTAAPVTLTRAKPEATVVIRAAGKLTPGIVNVAAGGAVKVGNLSFTQTSPSVPLTIELKPK